MRKKNIKNKGLNGRTKKMEALELAKIRGGAETQKDFIEEELRSN